MLTSEASSSSPGEASTPTLFVSGITDSGGGMVSADGPAIESASDLPLSAPPASEGSGVVDTDLLKSAPPAPEGSIVVGSDSHTSAPSSPEGSIVSNLSTSAPASPEGSVDVASHSPMTPMSKPDRLIIDIRAQKGCPAIIKYPGMLILGYMGTAWGLLLLYGIYLRPYAVRPHVDTAALAAFDLAPGNDTLRYDLALNITFWNDHRIWDIYYDHFSARLYFNGTKISSPDDTFPKFRGRTRRHRTVHPALRGRASNVSAAMAEDFSWQRAQGWFQVEVRLRATLSYRVLPTWTHYYYEFDCWLHFPSNATAMPAVIGDVKCSKGKRFGLS